LITGWDEPPPPLVKVIDDVGNGKYQTEESYNAELAEHFGYVLLDKHLVDVPGVQRSGFEVCDLLDIEEKRLIHVKKNSRRSSVLSHFFKQGANSAQNLASVPTVSDQLAVVVEDLHGESARAAFHDANSDVSRKWTIEFWIADAPRASGEFNIPFFSKISLRDEVRRMRAMSYRVALRFIRLDV